MSISSLINSITSVDREMRSLQQQFNSLQTTINNKNKEAHRILENINREKSLSRLVTLQKDLTRKNEEIARVEKDKLTKEKSLSDKQKKKYDLQQQLAKEEQKERDKALKDQKELLSIQQQISREMEYQRSASRRAIPSFEKIPSPQPSPMKQYDVFVSHASEDKEDFVRPFVNALVDEGLSVWYDEFELYVGKSLRRSIDAGLSSCKFGIVVLSEHFFKKEWPQKELDGLFAREVNGEKIILPIWHKISKNEVLKYSPPIADLVALNSSTFTVEEMAKEIAKAVDRATS